MCRYLVNAVGRSSSRSTAEAGGQDYLRTARACESSFASLLLPHTSISTASTLTLDVSASFACLTVESYASQDLDQALVFLNGEVACVNAAAGLALELGASPEQPYVLSIGATPTAHVAKALEEMTLHGTLELYVFGSRRTDRKPRWQLLLSGSPTSCNQPQIPSRRRHFGTNTSTFSIP